MQMYQRAVEEDPEFALAWTKISRRHTLNYNLGFDRTESRLALALEAVERAFQVSPDLPQAHLAMSDYYRQGIRDFDRALEETAIAERGMPGSADLYFARADLQRRVGEWDESLENWERVIELDPRSINAHLEFVRTHIVLRNYQQAEQSLERALEFAPDSRILNVTTAQIALFRDGLTRNTLTAALYERDYDTALSLLDSQESDVSITPWSYSVKASRYGLIYRLAGEHVLAEQQFEVAREQLEAALESRPDDPRLYNALGAVLAGLGENEEAVRMARQAIDDALPTSRDTFAGQNFRLDAVMVFAAADDSDAAIEELDAYLGAPGWWSIEGLLPDPRLDPIRDDPRFQALVEKYRRQ